MPDLTLPRRPTAHAGHPRAAETGPSRPCPRARRGATGDPVGRRQFADLGPFKLESGGRLPAVRLAYETWGELNEDGSNAVLVLHALTGDSHVTGDAGDGHPTRRLVASMVGPGRPHRHRPLVRRRAQRARRLPGLDGPVVARARRPAVGQPVPAADRPRPGRRGGPARRPAGHRLVGAGHRRVHGRAARARVGRERARAGRGVRRHRDRRADVGRPDRRLPHAARRRPRRPALPRRRLLRRPRRRRPARRASASRGRSRTRPTAARSSSTSASAASRRAARTRSRAAGSRCSPTWTTTATS